MDQTKPVLVVDQGGAGYRITLGGSLDLEMATALYRESGPAVAGARVTLEWAEPGFVGAAALQVLLALQAATASRGGTLDCPRPPEAVARTLELAGARSLWDRAALPSGAQPEAQPAPDAPARR